MTMSKVIFLFAGTGDDGFGYYHMKETKSQFHDDVLRIYIKGCHKKGVGNGFLFPDLEIAANNVRNAFEGNELDLVKLRELFAGGLYTIEGRKPDNNKVQVDELTLDGFSRGAVTVFATAKKLDDLNIPMHIIANQPVPGDTGIARGLYSRYCDLRGCHNIKSAHTFLASSNLEQGFVHNYFFRQMVAKFSDEVNAQQIIFPHQHHVKWFTSSPIHNYANKLMAGNGLTPSLDYESAIREWYQNNKNRYFFTPHKFMQNVYGADGVFSKDPIYLDVLVTTAHELLAQNNMEAEAAINPEQANAIIAIAHMSDEAINSEIKIKLYSLVLKDAKRAEQFVNIVNKVTEICDYLPYVTLDGVSNKSQLIKLHANNYKRSIVVDSFDFLSKDKPSIKDKQHFSGNIYKAESIFREQALGIERTTMRTILKLLTNFITHITGLALIVNTINKVKTGNWLLFQHNRSENAVRDTRKKILDDVDILDSSQDNGVDFSNKPLNVNFY